VTKYASQLLLTEDKRNHRQKQFDSNVFIEPLLLLLLVLYLKNQVDAFQGQSGIGVIKVWLLISLTGSQLLRVKFDVVLYMRGDKVVVVAESFLSTKSNFLPSTTGSLFKIFWKQLTAQEKVIRSSLINQNFVVHGSLSWLGNQFSGVMIFASIDRTKVILKGFFSPRTLRVKYIGEHNNKNCKHRELFSLQ